MTSSERNKFRGILLSEISVPAIDKVCIILNETIFINEQIAQRLSLIPINPLCNLRLVEKDKCDCENNCSKCTVFIRFQSKKKLSPIYSHDISPIFYPGIKVIFTTTERYELDVVIKITRKSPSKHTKWSIPVVFKFSQSTIKLCNRNSIRDSNQFYNITLSCDLPYNLEKVMEEIIERMSN